MKRLFYPPLLLLICFNLIGQTDCFESSSQTHFSLDQCSASGSFEEFVSSTSNEECDVLTVVGGTLYRDNPLFNSHSCTPGFSGLAMCVSIDQACEYNELSEKAIKFDIEIDPQGSEAVLSGIDFYEQSSDTFTWVSGQTGANNFPTKYAITVKVNGDVVYQELDMSTNQDWTIQSFDFSSLADFTVSSTTIFNFELLPYCPVGNGAYVSAWDIDELYISAGCSVNAVGGDLEGGPFSFCVNDGEEDVITNNDLLLSGTQGNETQWVITNEDGNILGLPNDISDVNFDDADTGVCLIWNLSYSGDIEGLEVGNNASELEGCFDLSNSVTVLRSTLINGVLEGGPFSFCIDGIPDSIEEDEIQLVLSTGNNDAWVITNGSGDILGLPSSISDVDFDAAGVGLCLIWNVSYNGVITGLEVGQNANELEGCFALSNPIQVNREIVDGGVLEGGPFLVCSGDNITDFINDSDVVLNGSSGSTSRWVLVNCLGQVQQVSSNLSAFNLDQGDVCLIYHISYNGAVEGLELNDNFPEDLVGCYGISNPVEIVQSQVAGGMLESDFNSFCVGDGEPDFIEIMFLTGNSGAFGSWVITDNDGMILGLPDDIFEVDFDDAGDGVCLIRYISHNGNISNLEVGNLIGEVEGCYAFTNEIPILRSEVEGGIIESNGYEFCVGDSIPDMIDIDFFNLTGALGPFTQWVITDSDGVILGLPDDISEVDFDEAGPGTCYVWNISYSAGLSGLVVGINVDQLTGCHDFSNAIEVKRNQPNGGMIEGGPFLFCVGDGEQDIIQDNELLITGFEGEISQLVVFKSSGIILGLPDQISDFDFDETDPGFCFIVNLSFQDGLIGLGIGDDIFELQGCFAYSNFIQVEKKNDPIICSTLECNESEELVLFGILDHTLIILDQTDGQLLKTIPLVTDLEGRFSTITWNNDDEIFYAVGDAITNPTLVKIDPVTGIVTVVGEIREVMPGANDLTLVESLEYNPEDQMLYCSAGNNPPNNNFTSRGLYRVNKFSGDATLIQNFSGSCQGEADKMTYSNGAFYYLDGCPLPVEFGSFELSNANQTFITNLQGFTGGGFDAHPVSGEFWLSDVGRELYTMDNLGNLDLVGNMFEPGLFENVSVLDLSFAPYTTNGVYAGGLISDSIVFCVDNGEADSIDESQLVQIAGTGESNDWIIVDEMGTILGLPTSIFDVDFEGNGEGSCYIISVSYDDELEGAQVGGSLDDLLGCYDLSNAIEVVRQIGNCTNIIEEEFSTEKETIAEEKISTKKEIKFALFPNPSNGKISLDFQFRSNQQIDVRVMNSSGELVKTFMDLPLKKKYTLDLVELQNGIYFIQLRNGNTVETRKVVLLK